MPAAIFLPHCQLRTGVTSGTLCMCTAERDGDISMLTVDKPISQGKSRDLVIIKHGRSPVCL